MDVLEPVRCPHGGEFYALADGSEYWFVPCPQRVCESQAVAVPEQVNRTQTTRPLLSA